MLKRKLLAALTAALLTSAADLGAAIVTAPAQCRSSISESSDDVALAIANPDRPEFIITPGGDDSAPAKAEVMKKKKKKKKGKPS